MASPFIPTQRSASNSIRKDDLPPESLSKFYEERKKIIFNKMDINKNEYYLLDFLKRSQIIVNDKCKSCVKGVFFQDLPSNIFNLSNSLKENISI